MRKILLLTVLLLATAQQASAHISDPNGDGEINIADVNAVIDMILTENVDRGGDVNGDGEVNIADVNALIDMILNN